MKRILTWIVVGFAICIFAGWLYRIPEATSLNSSYGISADLILSKVGNYRVVNGLNTLTRSQSLCMVASTRLSEVKINFSHDGFVAQRFCDVNCYLGENLARYYKSEQSTFEGWMNSPSHNDLMLKPVYRYGCVATNGQYTVLIVSDVDNITP